MPPSAARLSRSPLPAPTIESDVGHEQHDKDLKEALGVPGGQTVLDDKAEEIGPDDAEDAADHSPDQPFQADLAQPEFKQDNGRAR